MPTKDYTYYQKIIDGLEERIKQLDISSVRYREDNLSIKRSKVYRLSKQLAGVINPLRQSYIGKAYRLTKKIYRKATSASPRQTQSSLRPVDHIIKEQYALNCNKKPMASKVQIGLVMRDGTVRPQSSAFIRLIAPFTSQPLVDNTQLHLFGEDITGETDEQKNVELFVVQRTAFSSLDKATSFLENIRKNKAKLVIDLDDALGMLDESHEQFSIQHKSLEALDYLVQQCDQMWCSTQVIADYYSHLSNKPIIIRNTIDLRTWSELKSKSPSQPEKSNQPMLQMIYMGTRTHLTDYRLIAPALDRVHALAPGSFEVTLVGISGDIAGRPYLKRIQPPEDSTVYPRFIKWLSAYKNCFDIGLSPLEGTRFNTGKSDIKCIDYLSIGAVPVVSDLAPYRDSDLIDYAVLTKNTVDDWTNTLLELINDSSLLENKKITGQKGFEYLKKHRTVKNASILIDQQIKQLLSLKS